MPEDESRDEMLEETLNDRFRAISELREAWYVQLLALRGFNWVAIFYSRDLVWKFALRTFSKYLQKARENTYQLAKHVRSSPKRHLTLAVKFLFIFFRRLPIAEAFLHWHHKAAQWRADRIDHKNVSFRVTRLTEAFYGSENILISRLSVIAFPSHSSRSDVLAIIRKTILCLRHHVNQADTREKLLDLCNLICESLLRN